VWRKGRLSELGEHFLAFSGELAGPSPARVMGSASRPDSRTV
jgi:hypothetical protein